jgi:protein required for attachment to host cells
MDPGGVTWVVVADAERIRIFLERRRSGELVELEAERMTAADDERPEGHRHRATVHASSGAGRHGAGERQPEREAAQRFLHRVARRLEARLHDRAFDALAILAPPRALGLLRSELSGKVSARLTAAEAHECVGETADQIRARLCHVRAGTWSR